VLCFCVTFFLLCAFAALQHRAFSAPPQAVQAPKSGTVVHPLTIRIVRKKIATADLMEAMRAQYPDRYFKVEIIGAPFARGAKTGANKPVVQWKRIRISYRKDATQPWYDNTQRTDRTDATENVRLPAQEGQLKTTLQATVTLGTRQGAWRGTATGTFFHEFTALESYEVMRKARPNSLIEKPRPLVKGREYITKLQWSRGEKIWRDVPQRGERGYPLHVPRDSNITVRAVKADVKTAWPNYPYMYPDWNQRKISWGIYSITSPGNKESPRQAAGYFNDECNFSVKG